jgi:acetylornithine/succinyldiaminopimelate/putrescine aminotransferase
MDHKETFLNHLAQTSETPYLIEVERAEGIYIYDKKGKAYMDMIAGVAVNNIGHRHPDVIKAIHHQIDKHLHVMVYGEFVQDSQVEFAQNLNHFLPDSLDCHYIVNSGTEANEGALKLAKRYTGRSKIISFKKSYHGSTHGSLSATGNEEKKFNFRPLLPLFEHINFNKTEDLENINSEVAAVIVEPIQGDAGVRIPDLDYMLALRAKCTEVGALLIFDEVQTGIGRTGKMFAFEHFNIVPDILVLGKGLGGGMSIGCFTSSKEIMSCFTNNPMLGHITTFGGHPVNSAAAAATLNVLKETDLIEASEEKGAILEEMLLSHIEVFEIRRKGLMFAIDMESFDRVYKVVEKCLEKGLISFWFLSCPNSFRLSPPLTISKAQIIEAGQIILDSIDETRVCS